MFTSSSDHDVLIGDWSKLKKCCSGATEDEVTEDEETQDEESEDEETEDELQHGMQHQQKLVVQPDQFGGDELFARRRLEIAAVDLSYWGRYYPATEQAYRSPRV